MADQKHTLRLVAKLDTSDVQRELAKLNGGRSGGLNVGTRTGGGAYPSGSNRGENSLAIAANRLGTSFERLQGVFGKLEHGFSSVNDQITRFGDSLREMSRNVSSLSTKVRRNIKTQAAGSYDAFSREYKKIAGETPEQRAAVISNIFEGLQAAYNAASHGPVTRRLVRGLTDKLAKYAMAEAGFPAPYAYRYGLRNATGKFYNKGELTQFRLGDLTLKNPRLQNPSSPISNARPGFVSFPDLRGMFGAAFSPEKDERNYRYVNPLDPVARDRRREELRRAGMSARRWAGMFVAQAVFSGGQRLAEAYGNTTGAKTLGLLGSIANGAISGGAIGGMFGFGAGAMPGAIIGGVLGLGTGAIDIFAGNVAENRANAAAVRAMRQRMEHAFGLQDLARLDPRVARHLLDNREDELAASQERLEAWDKVRDAKGYQAEVDRYQALQQEVAVLQQVTDAEKARVKALEDSKKALDDMKSGRGWRLDAAAFAEDKDLAALNRLLGIETSGMEGATDTAGFAFHANRADQLEAMIKGVEAEFKAMDDLRSGRAFTGLLGGLVKGGDFDALSKMVAQFEELAKNATGLKDLSEALSKLTSVEGARDRVRAFRDMKENWKWGGWIWSLGKDKSLSMLHSAYLDEWHNRNDATNVEDWNLANSRVGTIQSTADNVVREMVRDLESRMPTFDASLTTSLAQFGISMGEAKDNVSRQMQVWEEQTELQRQIRDLIEQNKWTSEYQ